MLHSPTIASYHSKVNILAVKYLQKSFDFLLQSQKVEYFFHPCWGRGGLNTTCALLSTSLSDPNTSSNTDQIRINCPTQVWINLLFVYCNSKHSIFLGKLCICHILIILCVVHLYIVLFFSVDHKQFSLSTI